METALIDSMKTTLGSDLVEKIQDSKVLLVGAGGIGCEVLKNLALSGFRHVEVIDLDTIDVSNLNRQFLFRMQHVGMPKCTVACEAASKMARQEVKFIPRHGNVCDNDKFNVQYISKFDLVFNALDNVTARRRVNRLCLAASVPLIEAGTTGYLGQVTVIDKASNVECYECQPKPTQKVYPICTIRSTPSMPVHTIVWAKELYKLLLGPKVEESMLYEDDSTPEGEGEEQEDSPRSESVYMPTVQRFRELLDQKSTSSSDIRKVASEILAALYHHEIEKQIGMDRYKTAKKTPKPLSLQDIETGTTMDSPTGGYTSTTVWTAVECISEFANCLQQACEAKSLLPEFDKDDDLGMRFVTATSNLRSFVFGIEPLQSIYSAKGIAGNIIPAIATTNAVVAGLQVLQAFQILKTKISAAAASTETPSSLKDSCKYVYCAREKTRKGLYLIPSTLPEPNPKCFVCRNATISISLQVDKWTLQDLLSRIIKKDLGFEQPTIMLDGDIVYEEGDGAEGYQVNLPKLLPALPAGGIREGTMVSIEDFSQDLEVDVCVTHRDVWDEEKEELDLPFVVGGDKPKPVAQGKTTGEEETKNGKEKDDDDDDIEIVQVGVRKTNGEAPKVKRPNGEDVQMNGDQKRRKLDSGDKAMVIEID